MNNLVRKLPPAGLVLSSLLFLLVTVHGMNVCQLCPLIVAAVRPVADKVAHTAELLMKVGLLFFKLF